MRRQTRIWVGFTLAVTVLILIFLVGLFMGLSRQAQKTVDLGMLDRGRSLFQGIVLTRRWVANHGGVYVYKRPGEDTNPFLKGTDIKSSTGRTLVLRNPAMITREISEMSEKAGGFRFHITSDQPLNPGNKATDWELEAIRQFGAGGKERYGKVVENGKSIFRYMAPLFVEKSCMKCHADQGYEIGDVRGGIAVSFDISEIETLWEGVRKYGLLFYLLASALFLALIGVSIWIFQRILARAEEKLVELANTDGLTGLDNRRHFMERLRQELERSRRYGHPLSLIMLDLDHFKRVNDEYGHLVGDEVLRRVAGILRENTRKTDVAGRYGGEELVIALPESDLLPAVELAEKLRLLIAELVIGPESGLQNITASFGVVAYHPGHDTDMDLVLDELLKQVDIALYRAKEAGRNRVSVADVAVTA